MKDFNQIYKKIYDECYEEIEKRRKEKLRKRLILCAFCVIIAIIIIFPFISALNLPILILASFISLYFIVFISFAIFGNDYNKIYKNIIISRLVSYYDKNLEFNESLNTPEYKYKFAEFENYDEFNSNDFICGKIDGIIDFELGDVHTINVSTNSKGQKTRTTIFQGLFSTGILGKNLPDTIKIRSDKGLLGKLLYNKTQMSMDSQEFEKYFDIYANDKITAMRILTSDIMDYMIKFKKENKVNFEITLKQSSLYIRINCKNMFEGSVLKNGLDFNTLHTYFKYLDFMCQLNKKIYNIINEKDF